MIVASLLKGFSAGNRLIITVYKTLYYYSGEVCEVQLGITVDQTVR